ncbi:MAG: heme ABC exporter ATP-binding protein CcmA [Gammaproteobacteria bacterium]|nr:MAG: heme ABC exporter ATP-binding protein CcmA [Gammaproteobacteria bacterium]
MPLFNKVDFSLSDGEALQISGANGSGKTSMIRCLCGLSQRFEGEILFNQQLVDSRHSNFFSNTLYLGHKLGLKPKLTVAQNLEFYFGLRDFSHKNGAEESFESRMNKALKQLSISAYFDEPVGNLSAGQKRRVSLARLLTEPVDFWILDEPMVALDTLGQEWLQNACNNHLENNGMLLVTSHQTIAGIDDLKELMLTQSRSMFDIPAEVDE